MDGEVLTMDGGCAAENHLGEVILDCPEQYTLPPFSSAHPQSEKVLPTYQCD
jgi:hypothetical protein